MHTTRETPLFCNELYIRNYKAPLHARMSLDDGDTIMYEIAPIYDQTFLMACPMLRRHIMRVGLLEYEKVKMEAVDLDRLERATQAVVSKIKKNREDLVKEYECMLKTLS